MGVDPPSGLNVFDWADITGAVTHVADRVRTDGVPDVIVAVLRGGLVPAAMLAHQLGVRSVRAVEVVHTADDSVDAAKTAQPIVDNPASLGDLTGRDVLVVDDIAGSGDTMTATAELVRAAGAARVRTAVCLVNTANWRRPEPPAEALSYLGAAVEGWVIFPWENR